MRKRDELVGGCMAKALDDEMTFVLLGRDPAAPNAIREWADGRIQLGKNHPQDPQILEAEECARIMEVERDQVRAALARPVAKMKESVKDLLEELEEAAQKLDEVGHRGDAVVVRAAIAFIREHPDRNAPDADDVIDDVRDRMIQDLINKATDRRGFARVAANIAEDRYSAGSTAARCAIAILLRHGIQAAVDFAKDLDHHEG